MIKDKTVLPWQVEKVIEAHKDVVYRMAGGTMKERWEPIFQEHLGIGCDEAWRILNSSPDSGPYRRGD